MRYKIVFFLWLLLSVLTSSSVAGSSLKLVWLVIDQVSLDEIDSAVIPNISYLQKIGAFGLVNVRTAGHLHSESTYLTIGTGKRSQGSKNIHIIKENRGVIYPQIEDLKKMNKESAYQAEPGLLGMICRKEKIKVGILGNCDTAAEEKRTIISLVMDEKGYVPYAEIGKTILRKIDEKVYPWGYQTDWQEMQFKFLEFSELVDALVIETGDLSRIEDYKTVINQDMLKEEKLKALQRIDSFIGFLIKHIDLKDTQLAIIVPTPPVQEEKEGEKLSWLLFAGSKYQQGWLTSLSTRRRGIITIQDLLPTFLLANDIEIENILPGKGITCLNDKVNWSDLKILNDRITLISNLRPSFVKGFIFLQLFVILLSILKTAWKKLDSVIIIQRLIEYLLLALLLIPLNYLIISKLAKIRSMLFVLVILTVLEVIFLSRLFSDKLTRLFVIFLSLDIAIMYDLINGYFLMADSLLGYSSIIGARYYGLGNEYMGLFIGSFLLMAAIILENLEKNKYNLINYQWLLLPLFFSAIYFTGAVNLGANFGGIVTAVFSFGISYLAMFKKGNKRLKVVFVFSLFFLVLIFIDYMELIGPSSHIGQALKHIFQGSWQELMMIVKRKVSMNLKLLRWTIWTKVLLGFIVYLLLLLKYPVWKLESLFRAKPYLAAGFYGSIVGSVVTMFVNDSGVVAAATILFYPVLSILYLIGN